jgi:hypothetical protein
LLQDYHGAALRSLARQAALESLHQTCQAFLKQGKAYHPAFGPLLMLAAGVAKQMRNMAALASSQATQQKTVNSVLTDSAAIKRYTAHGLSPVIRELDDRRLVPESNAGLPLSNAHLQFHGDITIRHNYWMEAADPLHRFWGGAPDSADRLFDHWLNCVSTSSTNVDFFAFVDHHKDGLMTMNDYKDLRDILYAEKGVRYMTNEERWRFRVKFDPQTKLAMRRDPKSYHLRKDKKLKPFSTRGLQTLFSGDDVAIWVCSEKNYFYSHSHKLGKLHHSSFMGGENVQGAGEWAVSDGQIVLITHKTGHYRASVQELIHTLQLLNKMHDLRNTLACAIDFSTDTRTYHWAIDILAIPDLTRIPLVGEVVGKASDPWMEAAKQSVAAGDRGQGLRARWYVDNPDKQAPTGTTQRKRAMGGGATTLTRWSNLTNMKSGGEVPAQRRRH